MLKTSIFAILLVLVGCAGPQPANVPTGSKIEARVAISMTPEERSQKTRLDYYQRGIWFPEGEIVREAALTQFSNRFTNVTPRDKAEDFHAVVEVEGDSILNPLFSTYYATATARAYLPDGKLLGTYRATASSYANIGNVEYDKLYQDTYGRAFAEVAQQFAASDEIKTMKEAK
jgi:hypothetical protein